MGDLRQLAMDGDRRTHHVAAEGFADALMAETDAEQRHGLRGRCHEIEADAGLARRAGARRQDDCVGLGGHHRGDGHLIVAMNGHGRAERAQIMHQVPGETVVIVDQRDGRHVGPCFRRSFRLWQGQGQAGRLKCQSGQFGRGQGGLAVILL